MAIGFYNFQKLHDQEFQKAALKRIEKIISQNSFIDGEYNKSFEAGFAKMQQAKHCELVANGTDALEIALQAFGITSHSVIWFRRFLFYTFHIL